MMILEIFLSFIIFLCINEATLKSLKNNRLEKDLDRKLAIKYLIGTFREC